MTNYTQPVRKTVIISVRVHHLKRTDPFFPKWALPENSDTQEVWSAWITTRSGLLPEKLAMVIFLSEEDANEFVAENPSGREVSEDAWADLDGRRHEAVREMVDKGASPIASGGGEDSPLALDVLEQSGVLGLGYAPSETVLNFIGKSRVEELKERFGENWSAAAEFEYCCVHFPHSSPAYVAAAYQFHFYVTRDDFSAGYLWRDLECLVHGVETAAIKSFEMRKKAGAAGSKRSAKARATRRAALMDAMETIAERNPDIAKLGAKTVAEVALVASSESNPSLWKQGCGQIGEYLGEIRRGEAGSELQHRYLNLFPANAKTA